MAVVRASRFSSSSCQSRWSRSVSSERSAYSTVVRGSELFGASDGPVFCVSSQSASAATATSGSGRRRPRRNPRGRRSPARPTRLASSSARGLGLLDLEHEVLVERRLDLRLQLHDRKLQQADRLLELRRHRQLLRQLQLQRRFQHANTLTGLLRGRILLLGTLHARSYSTESRPASPMPSMSRCSEYRRDCRFPVSRAHYDP